MDDELKNLYDLRTAINDQIEYDPDNSELWDSLDEVQDEIENLQR